MQGYTTAWQRLPGNGRQVKQSGSILRANEQSRIWSMSGQRCLSLHKLDEQCGRGYTKSQTSTVVRSLQIEFDWTCHHLTAAMLSDKVVGNPFVNLALRAYYEQCTVWFAHQMLNDNWGTLSYTAWYLNKWTGREVDKAAASISSILATAMPFASKTQKSWTLIEY